MLMLTKIEASPLAGIMGAIRPPEKLDADEWAEANLVLSERNSMIAGPLRLSVTPYLRGPLKFFSDPNVRRVSLCWGTQSGKTTMIFCCMGYIVDYAPGPTLIVYPTIDMATAVSKDRLQPLLMDCPALRKHMTKSTDDLQLLSYTLDAMTVRFGWSGSSVSVRSHPIKYLFKDEKSAFTPGASRAADERTKTFWNHKIVEVSTPERQDDPMWQTLGLVPKSDEFHGQELWQTYNWKTNGSTAVYFYEVKCPKCKKWIRFEFEGIRWDKDCAISDLDGRGWYECQKCGGTITDGDKLTMIQPPNAEWRSENPGGKWVACHMSSIYAPWDSCRFGAIAAQYLRAKITQDPEVMKRFVNDWLAMPYGFEQSGQTLVTEKSIESVITGYRRNQIPADVKVLVCGADVGEHQTHYTILGVGAGSNIYVIDWGVVSQPADLFELIKSTTWDHPVGMKISISIGGIDSRYRREEIVALCRANPVMKAVRGEDKIKDPQQVGQVPWRATALDRDHSGKALLGSLVGHRVNTIYWKQFLYGRLHVNVETGLREDQEAPLLFHLPQDRDAIFERHIQSEHEIRERARGTGELKRRWAKRAGFDANHYLDCLVYALCMGHAFNLFQLSEESPVLPGVAQQAVDMAKAKAKKAQEKKKKPDSFVRRKVDIKRHRKK